MYKVKRGGENMPWKPAKMLRFLKKHGFVEIGRYTHKGTSHIKLINYETNRYTEVPMHKSKELKKGMEAGILKQAGLTKEARSK